MLGKGPTGVQCGTLIKLQNVPGSSHLLDSSLMSSILHLDNVLINPRPILHGYSVHTRVVTEHCSLRLSVLSQRQSSSSVWEARISTDKFSPRSLRLYRAVHSRSWYSFSAQVPSPQTLAIQTWRRSRGGLLWFKHKVVGQFGNCIQENRKWGLHFLYNPTEVKFLHSLDPLVRKKQVSAV